MEEAKYTQNKDIGVILREQEEMHYLDFMLDEQISVCLSTETSQDELKIVFSALLHTMLSTKPTLVFTVSDGYSNTLIREVCEEYIRDLNSEINEVYDTMQRELDLS